MDVCFQFLIDDTRYIPLSNELIPCVISTSDVEAIITSSHPNDLSFNVDLRPEVKSEVIIMPEMIDLF